MYSGGEVLHWTCSVFHISCSIVAHTDRQNSTGKHSENFESTLHLTSCCVLVLQYYTGLHQGNIFCCFSEVV